MKHIVNLIGIVITETVAATHPFASPKHTHRSREQRSVVEAGHARFVVYWYSDGFIRVTTRHYEFTAHAFEYTRDLVRWLVALEESRELTRPPPDPPVDMTGHWSRFEPCAYMWSRRGWDAYNAKKTDPRSYAETIESIKESINGRL